jgi:hypothetical protein
MAEPRGAAVSEADRQQLLRHAEFHRARMRTMDRTARLNYVADLFAVAPAVIGAFPDPEAPGETCFVALKGGDAILQGESAPCRAAVIPCSDAREALTIGNLFGGSLCTKGFPVLQRL